jgi:hypothetical protein
MSGEAYQTLQEMATLCGCEDELESSNNKPKFYDKTDCNNNIIVKSSEEIEALRGEGLKVFFDDDKVYLQACDLSKIGNIKFREGAEVNLSCAKNLPKGLDVSMCSKVNLIWCDLEGLNLKFREGAKVDLSGARNLPEVLDLSMCSWVALHGCDLRRVKKLKFREGAEVDLYCTQNLPKNLDFSMCSNVDLRGGNLMGVKKIKFKDREQKEKFMEETRGFGGWFVYEETLFSCMKKRLGIGGGER